MRILIAAALATLLVHVGPARGETDPGASSPAWTLGAEVLSWWFKSSPTPAPLVTDGVLGAPATQVFLGGRDLDTNPNPGLRLTGQRFLGEGRGVEASVFYLPSRSTRHSVSASGEPGSIDLFMPYLDVTRPGENAFRLSSQGAFAGSASEELTNSLLGAELNGTMQLPRAGSWRVDVLGGVRYLRLRETYTFATDTPNIAPRPADVYQTQDRFASTNDFYGAQLGVRARTQRQPWIVTGTVKVALGAMRQSVDIGGWTRTNDFNNFGAVQSFAGGYYALPTNTGSYSRSRFAVASEAALSLGYQLSPQATLYAGYTLLFANSVARAPLQLNRNINPTGVNALVPKPLSGPAEPSFTFRTSDFWAQGLNVVLAVHF